jgi:hypothetical protein
MHFPKLDNSSIREAVSLWFYDEKKCIREYGHISEWDTELVTDMSQLFEGKGNFNEFLPWNTSNVKNMSGMFALCTSYNQVLKRTAKIVYWHTPNYNNIFICLDIV